MEAHVFKFMFIVNKSPFHLRIITLDEYHGLTKQQEGLENIMGIDRLLELQLKLMKRNKNDDVYTIICAKKILRIPLSKKDIVMYDKHDKRQNMDWFIKCMDFHLHRHRRDPFPVEAVDKLNSEYT